MAFYSPCSISLGARYAGHAPTSVGSPDGPHHNSKPCKNQMAFQLLESEKNTTG